MDRVNTTADAATLEIEGASSASKEAFARRHDLDALRAFAMLLGIALHAALPYEPESFLWPVRDASKAEWFSVFNAAIHGFRMPLFFLISGFFTAMLWRKRGIKALLKHRALRILAPLGISMLTIIPAMWVAIIGASIVQGIQDSKSAEAAAQAAEASGEIVYVDNAELIEAIKRGDRNAFEKGLENAEDLDGLDKDYGWTPLCFAAAFDRPEMCEELIRAGASVNQRVKDQGTALHMACFLGSTECVRMLVENEADGTLLNNHQATPWQALAVDQATTVTIAKLIGSEKSWSEISSGRAAAQALAPEGQERIGAAGREFLGPWYDLVMFLCMAPVFHHLWFLWFLVWLIVLFAVYSWIADSVDWRGPPRFLLLSPVCFLWLIPLTLLPQSLMGLLSTPDFGPDTSIGFVPLPHLFVYYALFFFFGAWYFDAKDEEGKLFRLWWLQLPVALFVVFPLGLEFTLGNFGFGEKILGPSQYRSASVILQVLYVWMTCFGMMGLFHQICQKERPWVRYLSDSSYWLYLTHLPLVILLQLLLRAAAIPAEIKFLFVCLVTTSFLLLVYQFVVRYTPIGTLLNGKRTRPSRLSVE